MTLFTHALISAAVYDGYNDLSMPIFNWILLVKGAFPAYLIKSKAQVLKHYTNFSGNGHGMDAN